MTRGSIRYWADIQILPSQYGVFYPFIGLKLAGIQEERCPQTKNESGIACCFADSM